MSYEYRIITDKKVSVVDLNLIINNLKNYPLFQTASLTQCGIFVPNEKGSELVGIGLIEEGFFVTANINGMERCVLFDIIQDALRVKGVEIIIEEE